MDYIIYTSEGFTQAEDGSDIENCQILDFQYNSPLTKQECKRNYLSIYSNNKTGLNDHELQIAIRISDDLCLAMRELITYILQNNPQITNKQINSHIEKLITYFNLD